MKTIVIVVCSVLSAIVFYKLRRFFAEVKRERLAEEERLDREISSILANSEDYIGKNQVMLAQRLGKPSSSGNMDFGLTVYRWDGRNLFIEAFVTNGICDAVRGYEEPPR